MGNSVSAQVQLVRPTPSEILGQCECDTAQLAPAAPLLEKTKFGLPWRSRSGKVGELVSGIKQTAAILGHRESPTGNMGLHFPYQATQMYYYRRPYNHHHVPSHLGESRHRTAAGSLGESFGYSNQIFDQAHEWVEAHLNSQGLENNRDGLLEYVDWKTHYQKRLVWEAEPDHEDKQHAEFRVPVGATLSADNAETQFDNQTNQQKEPQTPPASLGVEDGPIHVNFQDVSLSHQRSAGGPTAESP